MKVLKRAGDGNGDDEVDQARLVVSIDSGLHFLRSHDVDFRIARLAARPVDETRAVDVESLDHRQNRQLVVHLSTDDVVGTVHNELSLVVGLQIEAATAHDVHLVVLLVKEGRDLHILVYIDAETHLHSFVGLVLQWLTATHACHGHLAVLLTEVDKFDDVVNPAVFRQWIVRHVVT